MSFRKNKKNKFLFSSLKNENKFYKKEDEIEENLFLNRSKTFCVNSKNLLKPHLKPKDNDILISPISLHNNNNKEMLSLNHNLLINRESSNLSAPTSIDDNNERYSNDNFNDFNLEFNIYENIEDNVNNNFIYETRKSLKSLKKNNFLINEYENILTTQNNNIFINLFENNNNKNQFKRKSFFKKHIEKQFNLLEKNKKLRNTITNLNSNTPNYIMLRILESACNEKKQINFY